MRSKPLEISNHMNKETKIHPFSPNHYEVVTILLKKLENGQWWMDMKKAITWSSNSCDQQMKPNQNGAFVLLSPMIQWPNSSQAALELLEQSPGLFCFSGKHQKAPQLDPPGFWCQPQMLLHQSMLEKILLVPLLWLRLMELMKYSPWPTPMLLLHMHGWVLVKHMLPGKKTKLPSILN